MTRRGAVLPGAVVLLAVLVALSWWPTTRTPAVLTLTALAALAPLVGLRLHRTDRAGPWWGVSTMVASWFTALAVAGTSMPAALVAQTVGLLVLAGLFTVLFRRHHREAPRDRRRTRRETWGRRTDVLVVGTVAGLALAQSVQAVTTPGTPWSVASAPGTLVLGCLLLRFVASRADLGPSMQLLVGGGLFFAAYDCLVANSGTRIVGPQPAVNVVWALGAALFVVGALHPGRRTAFCPTTLRRLRSESARLIGLTPLVLVPIALSQLHPGGRLPTPVYLAVGALVGALAIVRGAQTIRGSEDQARRDPLTGLANRRGLRVAFDDLVPPTAAAGTEVGRLAVLDVDDFKRVNDTYGHETGDSLLVGVGLRLAGAVGARGTVARSGGDEFVLLLAPDAPAVEDLLHTAFDTPVPAGAGPGARTFPVRCSAGWVPLTGASRLPLALADADVALYAGKGSTRGAATRFAPDQREQVLGQLELAEDLRRLVAGDPDAGSLVLLFQPLVRLSDRTVVGCEALVRWQHPSRGLLGPDTFLPVAETQGLGAAVDTWVLEHACAAAATWDADRTVSVNLGRSSMVDPDLACRVRAALDRTGLPAPRLHLEITEHDQLPTGAGVAPLHALAATGVGISLDDFGTGYTSLAYLQRYPVSLLKLDRSITGADSSTALLTGIVAMAGALGIAVLAEGIETDEQCARLAGLGIDAGQGWLFGRPGPAAQLPRPAAAGNPM